MKKSRKERLKTEFDPSCKNHVQYIIYWRSGEHLYRWINEKWGNGWNGKRKGEFEKKSFKTQNG